MDNFKQLIREQRYPIYALMKVGLYKIQKIIQILKSDSNNPFPLGKTAGYYNDLQITYSPCLESSLFIGI